MAAIFTYLKSSNESLAKVGVHVWFWAVCLMASDKGGISAVRLSMQIGVSWLTASRMLRKIRIAMGHRDSVYRLSAAQQCVFFVQEKRFTRLYCENIIDDINKQNGQNKLSGANSNKVFKNKKNGNNYIILHEARDCTNSRDGAKILVYCSVDDNSQVFVRDEAEFHEKFIEVV